MKYRYTSSYLLEHPILKFSGAMIIQDQIECKEYWEELEKKRYGEDLEGIRREYRKENADGLFRLMRTDWGETSHLSVVEVALEREEEMLPIIKRRLLTTLNEFFIEDTTLFLAWSKEKCEQWILEHYEEVRSPDMQSNLCLILGGRADLSVADFLFGQVERFEREYPGELYEQGPLLGLESLEIRYGRF